MKLRYFDHNATTPLSASAKAAWLETVDEHWMNPSSSYRQAAAVRVRLESAREQLAELLEVAPERVVFTSGATEANNAVLRHWSKQFSQQARIMVNPTEHPSVIEAAKEWFPERIDWLPVGGDGVVEIAALEAYLQKESVAAVSVMAANNETGVLQPWREIAKLCCRAGVHYHCDASQWVGKMPLRGLGECSYITACAHKFGGPKSVGFLLLPEEGDGCRILVGGVQENGHRAGTEDFASVEAMLVALRNVSPLACEGRDAFVDRIAAEIPGVCLVGGEAERLWNTASLIMPEFQSVRWIRALEKRGFLVSSGSACSTGKQGLSHVLLAMGVSATAAGRALRISSGAQTSFEDWQALALALVETYDSLRREAESATSRVISID